tara:strand:- start:210 stop:416 length:207 start_codon:yes stop_codon:yes gene_type:complete
METKKLFDEIEKELGDGSKGRSPSPVEKQDLEPRNFHPPDSPVRRVFENGVEMDQRSALENYPSYVNP